MIKNSAQNVVSANKVNTKWRECESQPWNMMSYDVMPKSDDVANAQKRQGVQDGL